MEAAPDPDLDICDPHHHLWDHPANPYMLGELRADTAEARVGSGGSGVRRTVFVECMSGYRTDGPEAFRPVGETDFVVAADPDGFIAGIVGFADLGVPEIDDVLAAHVEAGAGRFRGIRHATAWDASADIRVTHTNPPPGLMGDPAFRRGFAALGRAGLSFDAWLYHPQIVELTSLARAHPEVTVVLDHLGGPLGIGPYEGRGNEVMEVWRAAIGDLASCPNVVVKLGGIGMPIFGMKWHYRPARTTTGDLVGRWGDAILWCIEQFGVDRCMFESNFPVDKASCPYGMLWSAFDEMAAGMSRSERAALFHGTAERTYRL